MQITLSSELKCRWNTVYPAAAQVPPLLCCLTGKSTAPRGCLLINKQSCCGTWLCISPSPNICINLQVCSWIINIWKQKHQSNQKYNKCFCYCYFTWMLELLVWHQTTVFTLVWFCGIKTSSTRVFLHINKDVWRGSLSRNLMEILIINSSSESFFKRLLVPTSQMLFSL